MSNLPPGCTDAMIDALSDDGKCPECGTYRDNEDETKRVCPECYAVLGCVACREKHEGNSCCEERQWEQKEEAEK